MVHLTVQLLKKGKVVKNFIDNIRIYARGGAGGQGIPSLGGNGGKGGDVYVVGDDQRTLKDILLNHPKRRFIANNGENSRRTALFGKAGRDVIIKVPFGVSVRNDQNVEIGEINDDLDKILIAKGTRGGNKFNNFMSKKSTPNQLRFDLKLIADLGLVGFPNAGKSTLLSCLSSAKPKIASYPFTTLTPQLGTIKYMDGRMITMADLPGLIDKAHLNVGMGHNFLKHVERTKTLVFVIDLNGFRLRSSDERLSPVATVLMLIKELEMYRSNLIDKPSVLVINKIDVEGERDLLHNTIEKCRNLHEHLEEVSPENRPKNILKFNEIHAISAKFNKGTEELKDSLRSCLDEQDEFNRNTNDLVETRNLQEYNETRLI